MYKCFICTRRLRLYQIESIGFPHQKNSYQNQNVSNKIEILILHFFNSIICY
jgi:hypothetical protein